MKPTEANRKLAGQRASSVGWLPIVLLVGFLGSFAVLRYSGVLDNRDIESATPQIGTARALHLVPPRATRSAWTPGVLYVSFAGGEHIVHIKEPAVALALQELRTVPIIYRVGKSGRVYVDGLANDTPPVQSGSVMRRFNRDTPILPHSHTP
jgi:hypothetical protein